MVFCEVRFFTAHKIYIYINMKNVEIVEINTVKDLREFIKDLPDDAKLGVYHYRWWIPKFDTKCIAMAIVDNHLAAEIDWRSDY